jgi:hypothetical protein
MYYLWQYLQHSALIAQYVHKTLLYCTLGTIGHDTEGRPFFGKLVNTSSASPRVSPRENRYRLFIQGTSMGNIKHNQPEKTYRKDKGNTELMQINL